MKAYLGTTPPPKKKKIHIIPYTVYTEYFLLSVCSITIISIQGQLHFFMWTELSITLFTHRLLCSWVQGTFNYENVYHYVIHALVWERKRIAEIYCNDF